MNLALDQFARPLIDEIVRWPPWPQKITSVRASIPLFRKAIIENEFIDRITIQSHFEKPGFARLWTETIVILETLTDIRTISEFHIKLLDKRDEYNEKTFSARAQSFVESDKMFDQGMYRSYVNQFGLNCQDLPDAMQQRLAQAKAHIHNSDSSN